MTVTINEYSKGQKITFNPINEEQNDLYNNSHRSNLENYYFSALGIILNCIFAFLFFLIFLFFLFFGNSKLIFKIFIIILLIWIAFFCYFVSHKNYLAKKNIELRNRVEKEIPNYISCY